MKAAELIIDEIPTLNPNDTVETAIKLMDVYKVGHLPVAVKNKYYGLVSETDLLDVLNHKDKLKSYCINNSELYINAYEHIFEVLKKVSDYNLTLIPVLNNDKQFLGSISTNHLMHVIAHMPVVKNSGGIIVLEVPARDYSLAQIARIVEENDARILASFYTSVIDENMMEVTIKVNKSDVQAILKSLIRFKYNIIDSYDLSSYKEDLKSRYDLLLKYLNP